MEKPHRTQAMRVIVTTLPHVYYKKSWRAWVQPSRQWLHDAFTMNLDLPARPQRPLRSHKRSRLAYPEHSLCLPGCSRMHCCTEAISGPFSSWAKNLSGTVAQKTPSWMTSERWWSCQTGLRNRSSILLLGLLAMTLGASSSTYKGQVMVLGPNPQKEPDFLWSHHNPASLTWQFPCKVCTFVHLSLCLCCSLLSVAFPLFSHILDQIKALFSILDKIQFPSSPYFH